MHDDLQLSVNLLSERAITLFAHASRVIGVRVRYEFGVRKTVDRPTKSQLAALATLPFFPRPCVPVAIAYSLLSGFSRRWPQRSRSPVAYTESVSRSM